MISRRNIRVKVMQTLYSLSSTHAAEDGVNRRIGDDILNDKLARALDLFSISVLYTLRVAEYAETDAQNRSSRYLVTKDDLNVSTKIAHNEFVLDLLSNKSFNDRIKDYKLERFIDEELVKKIYHLLTKTNEYQQYIVSAEREKGKEKGIIEFIWSKLILENEDLQSHFMDELPGWEDDGDMIKMLIDNFFKSSSKPNFQSLISDEKREYAHSLLQTVLDKEAYCMSLIHPKLKNWDTERVALIDILLLRMGVCELLYFPTIPTKVTINEYIEVAKTYSTQQSAQFINGVLDNILKDLEKEKKINKQERTSKS